jgi:hypothetical protein
LASHRAIFGCANSRDLLSPNSDPAKAINYILSRWAAFTRFLDDGRICLSNNAAERAIRGVAVGRRGFPKQSAPSPPQSIADSARAR